MSALLSRAPGAQQKRLAAYLESLAQAAGHSDRIIPFKAYCTGLLLPGERKSVEPMAARIAPDNVRRTHQSLHHLVADAPWDDEALLDRALDTVLASMLQREPVVAWVVDDTGFPKKGQHSVGVARQYCGQVGKQDNCRVAVSLSVTTEKASMPIAFRLYLPETWADDKQRRQKTGVPEQVEFQTKAQIALAQIERARERGVPEGVVLADAGYGNDTRFRSRLTEWQLSYVVGTETEMKEKKARVEDALHATRAAVEEGIVPGGGVALLRAAKKLIGMKVDGDEQIGVDIIRRACEEPVRQIAQNAGVEGAIIIAKIRENDNADFGYNAQTDTYEDLVKSGVFDPAKVTRTALQNAASIAGLMLTTEAMVGEIPEEKSRPSQRGLEGMK